MAKAKTTNPTPETSALTPTAGGLSPEKMKLLQQALSAVEKKHGTGSVMFFGSKAQAKIDTVSTGSLGLDLAVGVGGFPRGRISEIYGPESSGKTTICLLAVADAQRQGLAALYIDTEHALDPAYARKLGVDLDSMLIAQPDSGEEALDIAQTFIEMGAVGIVIVDSVATLVPKAEIEKDTGESSMGVQARMMSQAMRKLSAPVSKMNVALVFTNQIRQKIGVMFGNPETTPGGMALRFHASVRMEIRKIQEVKDASGESLGSRVRVRVVKNKVAPPFRVSEFNILYGAGVDKYQEILDLGEKTGILNKKGSYIYGIDGDRGIQGANSAKAFLSQHPEIAEALEKQIRAKFAGGEAELEEEIIPSEDDVAPDGIKLDIE